MSNNHDDSHASHDDKHIHPSADHLSAYGPGLTDKTHDDHRATTAQTRSVEPTPPVYRRMLNDPELAHKPIPPGVGWHNPGAIPSSAQRRPPTKTNPPSAGGMPNSEDASWLWGDPPAPRPDADS